MPLSLHVAPMLHIEAVSGVQHVLMSVTRAQHRHITIFKKKLHLTLVISFSSYFSTGFCVWYVAPVYI